MKVQLTVLDPKLVGVEGMSLIAGVIECDRAFNDYDALRINLDLREDGRVICILARDDIRNLAEGDGFFHEESFTDVLRKPVWRRYEADVPVGEIALVRTLHPDTPRDRNAYSIFGMINGEEKTLKALSGKVLETKRPLESGVAATMGELHDSGVEVHHTMGNTLLNVLRKPVWGFGRERYGLTSQIPIPLFERFQENTLHLIEHGKHLHQDLSRRNDAEYLDFLRGMHKRGLVPTPMWETDEGMKIRSKASDEVAREIQVRSRIDELARLKRQLSDSPSP